LIASNPSGRILIVNYYYGVPANFAQTTFASGFNSGTVDAFNQQIAGACAGGALTLQQVRCVDIAPAFSGMGNSYLIGATAASDLINASMKPEEQAMMSQFASTNPGGLVTGDGVHLSNAGKSALAAYLANMTP
jgi:hypothetical protein